MQKDINYIVKDFLRSVLNYFKFCDKENIDPITFFIFSIIWVIIVIALLMGLII
jgi:hypothetical protein